MLNVYHLNKSKRLLRTYACSYILGNISGQFSCNFEASASESEDHWTEMFIGILFSTWEIGNSLKRTQGDVNQPLVL